MGGAAVAFAITPANRFTYARSGLAVIKSGPMSVWRKHVLILAVLVATMVPVAIVDQRVLAPGGGDWISLDFRGLFLGAYAIWLLVHASVTSVAIARLRPKGVAPVHFFGTIASLVASRWASLRPFSGYGILQGTPHAEGKRTMR